MTVIIIMNLSLLYRRGRSTCLNTSMLFRQIQSRHVFSPLKIKQVHVQPLCNILRLLPNFKGTKNCFVFSLTKSKSVILSFNVYERKKKKISKSDRVQYLEKTYFQEECVVSGVGSKLLYKSDTLHKHEKRNKFSDKNVFEVIIFLSCENY